MPWWDDLGDDELEARLFHRLGGEGNQARARWLVEHREDEDVRSTITFIVGDG